MNPATKSSRPSLEEMGDRLLHNIDRVDGYLSVLLEESQSPDKLGPGVSAEEWSEATQNMRRKLQTVKKIIRKNF